MYLTRFPLRFGQYVYPTPAGSHPATLPLDIRRTDDAYVIQASVPGYTPEQVEVTVDQNWLVIRADRGQESESSEGGWVRRERRSSSIQRRLALPDEVDVEQISASVVNGELAITVPRSSRTEPRRVPVTTSAPAIEAPATEGDGTPTA